MAPTLTLHLFREQKSLPLEFHFFSLPKNDAYSKVRILPDVTCHLQLCRTLLRLQHFEKKYFEAFSVHWQSHCRQTLLTEAQVDIWSNTPFNPCVISNVSLSLSLMGKKKISCVRKFWPEPHVGAWGHVRIAAGLRVNGWTEPTTALLCMWEARKSWHWCSL